MTVENLTLAGALAAAVLGLWRIVLAYIDFLRDRLATADLRDAANLAAINRLADGVEKLAEQRAT